MASTRVRHLRSDIALRMMFLLPKKYLYCFLIYCQIILGPAFARMVSEARSRLLVATTEEHFQAVGLLCREVLISLAQAVFDPDRHPITDGTTASDTDARRMLEAVIAAELHGSSQEELRSHARATVKLAPALQHKRTADFRMAAICLEVSANP